MAQKINLKLPSESPLYCLKTGDVILAPDNLSFNENSTCCLFATTEAAIYVRPDLKDKWEEIVENDEGERGDPIEDFVDTLDDEYIAIFVDSSEGPLIENSVFIFDYSNR